jgi:DNA-binding response OmpR family regulator
MAHILIVDDDQNICRLLELYLANEGYSLTITHDGSSALDIVKNKEFDLVILDIMLPVINGWEVCKMIRRESSVPIIMLTARDLVEDKIQGFELGADDYIVKPFEPREVVARVKARLKNKKGREDRTPSSAGQSVLRAGNIEVDIDRYETRLAGRKIDLKPKEIQLLYFLLRNKNIVFSREQLLEKVWDYALEGDTRTVDVHINRLREKLEGDAASCHIRTIWGVGYKMECND